MKKIVIVFGLISGLIVSTLMAISMAFHKDNMDYDQGMWIGYTSMIIAFSLIFVGIKTFRDKHNQGIISFKKAFLIGLYISLIASTMYVITWAVEYHYFMPDFMDKYTAHYIEKERATGLPQVELDKKIAEMKYMQDLYRNPIFFVLFTYMEIIPVGIIIALLSAIILKRKQGPTDLQWEAGNSTV
jgi:hypothetical protein